MKKETDVQQGLGTGYRTLIETNDPVVAFVPRMSAKKKATLLHLQQNDPLSWELAA